MSGVGRCCTRAVSAFGLEDSGIAGVGVAPAEVAADRSAEGRVIGVVAVGDDELAQRPEVCLDRIGPLGIGRGEQQLDVVGVAPLTHVAVLVVVQVVRGSRRSPRRHRPAL